MYEVSVIIYLIDNVKIQAELAKLRTIISSSHAQSTNYSLSYLAYIKVEGYQTLAIILKDGVWQLNNKEVSFDYLQSELEKFDVELQVREVLNG